MTKPHYQIDDGIPHFPDVEPITTYIAGPMTSVGPPTWNYPAFEKMATRLRGAGLEVICPSELHKPDGDVAWDWYLRRDLRELVKCGRVVMLDGWANSKGAKLERHVAKTLGMDVIYEGDVEDFLERR